MWFETMGLSASVTHPARYTAQTDVGMGQLSNRDGGVGFLILRFEYLWFGCSKCSLALAFMHFLY